MVFLSHSLVGTRVLKVLVVPIGENSLFDAHFDLVSRIKNFPKEELSYSNSMLSKSIAFRNFQWDEGNFVFDYVRYDVAKGGNDLADYLDSSQRVLIVLGLVNHPELGESSDNMEDELKFFARNHPFIAVRRLIVFNYDYGLTVSPSKTKIIEDLPILRPLCDDSDSLVICPPEGDDREHGVSPRKKDFKTGSTSIVESRLKFMMANIAVIVFEFLQREMINCEDARAAGTFPNWLLTASRRNRTKTSDDASIIGITATPPPNAHTVVALTKKVQAGRLRKFMGDLCLQVCSPVDAIAHYTAAISECRGTLDMLWLAGALEGSAAAIVALLSHKPSSAILEELFGPELKAFRSLVPSTAKGISYRMSLSLSSAARDEKLDMSEHPHPPEDSIETNTVKIALDRCMEALSIYANNVLYSFKEASCSLRLARMFEELGPLSFASTFDRHTKVSTYVLRAVSVPGLTPPQRVEVTAQGAVIFRRAGLSRKYSLLLYMAGLMSAESGNVQKSSAQYGINLRKNVAQCSTDILTALPQGIDREKKNQSGGERIEDERSDEKATAMKKAKESMFPSGNAWTSMRLQLLAHNTHIARENGDFSSAAENLCAMVRLMGALEMRQHKQLAAWSSSTLCSEERSEREECKVDIPSRAHSTDLHSELGDDIVLGRDHPSMRSAGLLLNTAEGRRALSSELVNHRWRQHTQHGLTDYTVLSASNISRLVGSPKSNSAVFGLPTSGEKSSWPVKRSTSTNSRTTRSVNGVLHVGGNGGLGNGSGSGNNMGSRRGSGSAGASLQGNELDSRLGLGPRSFHGGPSGLSGSASGRFSLGSHNPLVPRHASLPLSSVRGERMESKYDEKYEGSESGMGAGGSGSGGAGGDFSSKHRRRSSGSSVHSVSGTRRSQYASVTGSVSSSSCFTVFAPPSILGISENTERRRKRIQMNKKKNPHSAAGRLINAQLQSYQTITSTASDAASFLSSIILPDGQPVPAHTLSAKKSGINMSVSVGALKAGLNLSHLSAPKMKMPSASRIGSMVLNTPVRASSPSTQSTPGNKAPPCTPETRIDTVTTSTSQKSGSYREDLMLATDGEEHAEDPSSAMCLCLDSLSRMLFEGGVSSVQQDQGLELLEQLSREVAPDTAVFLPFIVATVRPLSLQGPEAPLKGSLEEQRRWDTARCTAEEKRKREVSLARPRPGNSRAFSSLEAGGGSENERGVGDDDGDSKDKSKASALFYDPFEARRVRDTDSGLRAEVLWSVGATCTAVVVFQNPLGCPLYLTAVTLLAEGVEFVATPRSVVIPPRTEGQGVSVELSITPLEEGALKIVGVELCIHNAVHRLYSDLAGRVALSEELPSPWQYLYRNQVDGPRKSEKRGSPSVLPAPGTGGGAETSLITVAPAAPSLDLVPAWETQHLDNNSFLVQQLLGDDWEEGGGFVDRVVSLSLCPGETRREIVLAVLQPLLTGVGGIRENTGTGKGENEYIGSDEKSAEVELEGVCSIAEDMRITIHQWSLPPPDESAHPGQRFFKSFSLQRDFSGPLKVENAKQKPDPSCDSSCRLIHTGSTKGRNMNKNENGRTNVADNGMPVDGDSDFTSLSRSLSLPLGLEFEFCPGVVAYRLDVETLARNSIDNVDSAGSIDVQSQLYLRRSSLYVRVHPSPCVELLSSSVLTVAHPVASHTSAHTHTPIGTEAKMAAQTTKVGAKSSRFIVVKLRNSSRQRVAVSTSQAAARDALRRSMASTRDPYAHHPLHASSSFPYSSARAGSDISKRKRAGSSDFSEFLEPESTKNVMIPMGLWRKKSAESTQSPSGLFWALYDPFSSSDSTPHTSCPVGDEHCGNNFRGSIRSGCVLGISPLNYLPPSTPTPSAVPEPPPLILGAKIDANHGVKASLLFLLKGVLVFENSYTVNTKNNFKCQLWENYDLHLKITCSDPATHSGSAPPFSIPHANTASAKEKCQQFEIFLAIELVGDSRDEKESDAADPRTVKKVENAVLVNGKTRFLVSGVVLNNLVKNKNPVTSVEKLQICFPVPGIFSVKVFYRCIENISHDTHYSVSTIFVQVQ